MVFTNGCPGRNDPLVGTDVSLRRYSKRYEPRSLSLPHNSLRILSLLLQEHTRHCIEGATSDGPRHPLIVTPVPIGHSVMIVVGSAPGPAIVVLS